MSNATVKAIECLDCKTFFTPHLPDQKRCFICEHKQK